VESARAYVLEYFNASPDEYAVIFTHNASGALKLVGESYPFSAGGQYLLTFDNHNSVNGIREFARARGVPFTYIPVQPPDLRVDEASLDDYLAKAAPGGNNLLAFPAQSNFSGVQHPLEWITHAQARGWDVLLDAAAFVPTNRLDLSQWHPDFVDLSFYKMFGYPTGVGCLIVRQPMLAKLKRPWFAGGTITVASVQGDGYYLKHGVEAFEEGTINYLNVPAIEIGLRYIESVGIDLIHERVGCLTGWLIDRLLALRHHNGLPMVQLYGPASTEQRGGTVTINFYDRQGDIVDHRRIEPFANQANISLRTGCFCNPGAGEMALGLNASHLKQCFRNEKWMSFEQFIAAMDINVVGAVRVSLGIASNFADVYRFVRFVEQFRDQAL
ncbi:MAG TPA: aminotransferase class V-fold PLP-dependent enzyme, partial [Aggregatilineales bacterium]|nr:aminotransferase class V-fold PLP-dependent enzyme [Aggregatilineales bacterium]